jgi:hypothetical protein
MWAGEKCNIYNKIQILLDICVVFVWIINILLGNTYLEDVTLDCLSFGFNKYQDNKKVTLDFSIYYRKARIANFCNMNILRFPFTCK